MTDICAHGLIGGALKHSLVAATASFGIAASLPEGSKQIVGAIIGHSLVLSALDAASSPTSTIVLSFKDEVRTFSVHPSARFAAATLENKKIIVVALSNADLASDDQAARVSGYKILHTSSAPKKVTTLQWTDDATLIYSDKFGTIYTRHFTDAGVDSLASPGEPAMPLGHYSVVTDTLMIDSANSAERHIVTSDKDEKIRVSRWPHAYDIQCVCLGHRQYVTSLALIRNASANLDLMVSVGGDGKMFGWNYLNGAKLFEVNLSSLLTESELLKSLRAAHNSDYVSPTTVVYVPTQNLIVVSVEYSETVLLFQPTSANDAITLKHVASVPLTILPIRLSVDLINNNLWIAGVPLSTATEPSAVQIFNVSADSIILNEGLTRTFTTAIQQEKLALTKEQADRLFVIYAQEENLRKMQSKRGTGVAHAGSTEPIKKQAKLQE